QARGLDGEQSDRVREPLEGWAGPAAGGLRKHADRRAELEGQPPPERTAGGGSAVPDAARHLRRARHAEGRGRLVRRLLEEGVRLARVPGLSTEGRAQGRLR